MQYTPIPKVFFNYTCNQFQNELINFSHFLKDTHPAFVINRGLSNQVDQMTVEFCKTLCDADSVSLSDFQVIINQLASILHDAHTFFHIEPISLFPFELRFLNEDFYIHSIASNYSDITGKAITKVNDIDINKIKQRLAIILPSENAVKTGIIGSYFFNNKSLIDAISFGNKKDSLKLSFRDGESIIVSLNNNDNGRHFFSPQKHPVTYSRESPFDYCITNDICYFQFNSMFDRTTYKIACKLSGTELNTSLYNQLPLFSEFLQQMLLDMEHQKTDLLVVDMRHNGGGNSILGDILLEALSVDLKNIKPYTTYIRISTFLTETYSSMYSQQKICNDQLINQELITDTQKYRSLFNFPDTVPKYKGKTIFIQGQNTFSSANYLLSTIKDNQLFPIIGTPTSQRPTCYGNVIPISLPFTQSKGFISYSLFKRPDSSKDSERYLSPDITIHTSIANYLKGIDPCWNWVTSCLL